MEKSPPAATPSASKRPEKAFSCVRCFDRKVKCTKQIPCPACTRAGVECVFRQPAAPRRRRKRTQEEILLARLRRCEELLKSHGISPNETQVVDQDLDQADYEARRESQGENRQQPNINEDSDPSTGPAEVLVADPGRLVGEQGRAKFFENSLYSGLNEELREDDDFLEQASEDESETTQNLDNSPNSVDFLLGVSPQNAPLTHLHPPPALIYKLWQVFLDNVNPLIKIIHQPTLQSEIFDASFNLDKVPKGLEALMFSVYASAVFSMTEKECFSMLNEEKSDLLLRYRLGVRKALVRANFLASSDLAVLQAFTIYLLSMRMIYDAGTVWVLAGVANRLAQSLGLHKDGTTLGLSPFDTEIRRRLWWQIVILDSSSAELSGSSRVFYIRGWNTKIPHNVNDADLYPQMTQEPVSETNRATEMISCSLRFELGEFLRRATALSQDSFDGDWQLSHQGVSTDTKDKLIDELEQRFQEKYVRYCDVSIPIHFHTLIVARSVISSMRLMAHHPRHRSDKERQQPKAELDAVFGHALKIIECDNICHSTPVFQRFLWHTHNFFQWHAFIYLLGVLRTRTDGPEVDAAWLQIEQAYLHHPVFLTDTKKPLHVATGSLCLKAWQAREAALTRQRGSLVHFPAFVQTLRQQRSRGSSVASPVPAQTSSGAFEDGNANLFRASNNRLPTGPGAALFPPTADAATNIHLGIGAANTDFDTNMMLADFSMEDISPMNWDDWDSLVNGYGNTTQLQDWTNLPGH